MTPAWLWPPTSGIIDCGLKHELLTVNALAASDYCIIPVQAHFLVSEGIPDVLKLVQSVQARFNPRLKIAGILLTMYQSRPQLCQSVRSSVVSVKTRRTRERPMPERTLAWVKELFSITGIRRIPRQQNLEMIGQG